MQVVHSLVLPILKLTTILIFNRIKTNFLDNQKMKQYTTHPTSSRGFRDELCAMISMENLAISRA